MPQPNMTTGPSLKFTPGAGTTPPVLAGREREKAVITEALDYLGEGCNPAANIALIGPRGNGKTALLRWAEAHVEECEGKIKCVVLNPDCFKSYSSLVGRLADLERFTTLASDVQSASINILGTGISLSRQEAAEKLLAPVLEKMCSNSGLALLVDEAHTLHHNPEVARAFFNDAQALIGKGRPLLLILAGTPDTSSRLNGIEATFWNRLDKVGIGLLDMAASQEALRAPLERMGYRIDADALDLAADAAQRYPYFLQLIGRELHRSAKAEPDKLGGGDRIGGAILEQASKAFRIARNAYYADRWSELEAVGILSSAEAVARLFVAQKTISISTAAIKSAIGRSIDKKLEEREKASGGIESALWVEANLRNVGFIWSQFGNEDRCEPGIPSLMNYVMERADDRDRELKRIRGSARPDHQSNNKRI